MLIPRVLASVSNLRYPASRFRDFRPGRRKPKTQNILLQNVNTFSSGFHTCTCSGCSSCNATLKLQQLICPSNSNIIMSRPSQRCISWLRYIPAYDLSNLQARYRSGDKKLGETSIIRQEGHEIQEVPLAVLKQTDTESLSLPSIKSYIDLDAREEAAFVDGFNSYNSPQEILKMLDTIPSQEVTPFVGLSILKKLFELENNFGFRNGGLQWTVSSENSISDTFARCAIVSRLIDIIITTEDPNILLGALHALKCERQYDNQLNQPGESNTSSNSEYRKKLFDEVLMRITEGKFNLSQVCEAVSHLGKMKTDGRFLPNELIDKLWIGIIEQSNNIDEGNIVDVFKTLPHFSQSRRVVLNLVEKKLLSIWWKMDTVKVAQICSVISSDKSLSQKKFNISVSSNLGVSNRALSALSRCASLNIHQVSENDLQSIVHCFKTVNFYDESFEKGLNKYMKAKCMKISEPHLIATVMEYVKKFRIRSSYILEAVSEYVVVHKAANLSPPQISSIVSTFGLLDFQPPNGIKFWQVIEAVLSDKFIQFPPKDIIEVFLSCVYLMKFPLNFIDRIFSPYFLDRLHSNGMDYNFLQDLRSQLKLLDLAFTIECPNKYCGPLLPRDITARSIFIDGRILRMNNFLEDVLKEMLGLKMTIERSVVLPNLPLNSAYIADILISNIKGSESDRYNLIKNRISTRLNGGTSPTDNTRNLTILLIHIPEHYSRDGKHLIGSEIMRMRHLKLIGFNVCSLKYDTLAELKIHRASLKDYIIERLTSSGFYT